MALVYPGDRLGPVATYAAGKGTYVKDGHIRACVVGEQQVLSGEQGQVPMIQVVHQRAETFVPQPGNQVLCKVTRVMPLQALVNIVCVGERPLDLDFRGVIRQQDVRAAQKDSVVMADCFRPGDIVRAEVISLGDVRSYYLSTARNDLGVLYARSLAGFPMVPLNWGEMRCPESRMVEKRKVAKVGDAQVEAMQQ